MSADPSIRSGVLVKLVQSRNNRLIKPESGLLKSDRRNENERRELCSLAWVLSSLTILRRLTNAFTSTIATQSYCSFSYSALASFRMGMSGSVSFQRTKTQSPKISA